MPRRYATLMPLPMMSATPPIIIRRHVRRRASSTYACRAAACYAAAADAFAAFRCRHADAVFFIAAFSPLMPARRRRAISCRLLMLTRRDQSLRFHFSPVIIFIRCDAAYAVVAATLTPYFTCCYVTFTMLDAAGLFSPCHYYARRYATRLFTLQRGASDMLRH